MQRHEVRSRGRVRLRCAATWVQSSRMNLRRAFQRTRLELGRCTAALFGQKADGAYVWGTGILVDFRGTPLVLTCAHVLDPITGVAYVTSSRHSFQSEHIEARRLSDPIVDTACLVLRDPHRFREEKAFIPASDTLLRDIGQNYQAFTYGFPVGHPQLQVGERISPGEATAHFTSMTYFTRTLVSAYNSRLRRNQPRVEWSYGGNQDAKRFKPLPVDLTPTRRRGFSGGPIIVGGVASSWRLVGQVTDACPQWLFYNPISVVLEAIDKRF